VCEWRELSSEMLRRAVRYRFPHISKECTASIFRVKIQENKSSSKFSQCTCKIPNMESHPGRYDVSHTLSWTGQISHTKYVHIFFFQVWGNFGDFLQAGALLIAFMVELVLCCLFGDELMCEVSYCSKFPATDSEVPGSIPGATRFSEK
jgi:hypothetical protein